MRKAILILVTLIVVPLIGLSQCENKEKKVFEKFGTYYGCLNDGGLPHGEGKITFISGGIYDGYWENAKMHGKGSMYFDDGGNYVGDFSNDEMTGEGIYTKKTNELEYIENGNFNRGILINGSKSSKYHSGLHVFENIEGGIVINEKRNDKNYYKESDIISDKKSTKIDLERRSGTYYVSLEVSGIQAEWIFDSGAEILSIGKRLFDRLVNSGVKYRDLNMSVTTFGIGGTTENKYIIIDEIKIGEFTVKNVIAIVHLENDYSLMGIQFFDKFSNVEWNMKDNSLKLYK